MLLFYGRFYLQLFDEISSPRKFTGETSGWESRHRLSVISVRCFTVTLTYRTEVVCDCQETSTYLPLPWIPSCMLLSVSMYGKCKREEEKEEKEEGEGGREKRERREGRGK